MARGLSITQPDQKQKEAELLNFSSWVEINLNAIAHNLKTIAAHSQAPILPILKSDAYGHGAPIVAPFLISEGCSLLGVGTVDEALSILKLCKVPLMVLTPPLPHQIPQVLQHEVICTITSVLQLKNLASKALQNRKQVTVHIKVDTGLGRLGATHKEALELGKLIKKQPFIKLAGVFTHFADASNDQRFTSLQLHRLLKLKKEFSDLDYKNLTWHATNSKGLITLPSSHLDLVRIGTLLYGEAPLSLDSSWHLDKTWEFKTRLIQVRVLPPGHTIGYNREYRTKSTINMGIIPVGFNHGLRLEPQVAKWRQLKHAIAETIVAKSSVFYKEKPLPILGKVGMGLTCLDLSAVPNLKVGEEITVKMRRTTSNTALPKIYFLDNQVKCILWENKVFRDGAWRSSSANLF